MTATTLDLTPQRIARFLCGHTVAKHAVMTVLLGDALRRGHGSGTVLDPCAGDGTYLTVVRMLAPTLDLTAAVDDPRDTGPLHRAGLHRLIAGPDDGGTRYVGIVGQVPDDARWVDRVETARDRLAPGGRLAMVVPSLVHTARGERPAAIRAAASECEPLPRWALDSSGMTGEWSLLVIDAPYPGDPPVLPGWVEPPPTCCRGRHD